MSLPTEILDIILARVPFEKLVRTSCLSRAWRRRWESVPFLDICFDPISPAVPDTRALWRCAPPVRGFRAGVRARHFHRAARWLRALARKRDCHMPPAPRDFSGFPNLVSLNPSDVTLWFDGDGAQLERLVAAAPRLALLELANVFTMQIFSDRGAVDPWFIRAPNLRALLIIMPGALDNDCRVAETLPLLEEAYISINGLLGTQCFLDTFRRIATLNNLFFVSLDQADDTEREEDEIDEGFLWALDLAGPRAVAPLALRPCPTAGPDYHV
ncbi:hypothetical protein E2562_009171 [Oryza meyeriana var. granulata]|uniref:F-box domain-containing protein n=1 Tax=Oryza meyeriana var. granulata TaxID=110450 RepID=A0A6G1CF28_9ORYZ|nr:hypothetical protein E2562_009171 [Oryza meyeriana var. granulata]